MMTKHGLAAGQNMENMRQNEAEPNGLRLS